MRAPPRLLAVSDRHLLPADGWETWCAGLAVAGVDGLQVRERDLDDRELLALVEAARRTFAPPGQLLVSRRCDVALAAGADGVQLPADGLPIALARRATADRLAIGRSTHRLEEIDAARREGADFASLGPIFDTPSKRGRIAPLGLDLLASAAARGLPLVAIGGIDATNVAAAFAAGAAGVAAIRAFADGAATAALVAAAREAGR
jgi:thiamine-phosphate pyrophosphorylase